MIMSDTRYGIWSPMKGAFLRTRDRSRVASYSTLLEAATILRELGPAWAGCYVADCTSWIPKEGK